MRLTILGGGGFRVPLVYRALLTDTSPNRCTELTLYDTDESRLDTIGHVLRQQADGHPAPPRVRTTTDLDDALRGTDFVFSAIRVGGLEGRTCDERIPLAANLIGQETVGPGGIFYGLRTIPVALHIAERLRAVAPDAWLINFTNPAGMVTEALAGVLGNRVIGICDSPVGLCRRVAGALGVDHDRAWFRYYGLNHLGWLDEVLVDGRDRLPGLLSDPDALSTFEEGKLFGAEWLHTIGAIPNEYLHYYYFNRESVATIREQQATRGEFLHAQQQAFYASVAADPAGALAEWTRTRRQREATYMAESREIADAGEREPEDLHGGYEGVALALMHAIANNTSARLILNVRNSSTIPALDAEAVIEVPCLVDANGAHPFTVGTIDPDKAALLTAVKAAERWTIEAARTGSRPAALRALAAHPLVDSVAVARHILDEYTAHTGREPFSVR